MTFDGGDTSWFKMVMAGQILIMIHGLAATAAKHGFYLHRWIRVVNVMIYIKTRMY
jgi:hypothetical protein